MILRCRRALMLSMAVVSAVVASSGCSSGSSTDAVRSSWSAQRGALDAHTLQARWWSWAASQVGSQNPVLDTTGRQCANRQAKDVWFLAGSFGGDVTRRCTVPRGMPLALPVVNLIGPRADCNAFMSSAAGQVLLDGAVLPTQSFEATQIRIDAADGNPVTSAGGQIDGFACGIWALSAALPVGSHTLVIDGSSGSFRLHVEYQLNIA